MHLTEEMMNTFSYLGLLDLKGTWDGNEYFVAIVKPQMQCGVLEKVKLLKRFT